MAQTAQARPHVQEMVVVHRVFRREFGLAPRMVRQVAAGDAERAAVVAAHLTELSGMLHHHHTGEDEVLWPLLHARAPLSEELVSRMEQQHETVGVLLRDLDELLPQWGATGDRALGARLAEVLDQLSPALDEHLAQEEREVLPLVEEHVSAAEWAQLGERGRASIPKSRMLVLLGAILEDASASERAAFLSHMPPPARLAYRLVGKRRYERETAALRQGITVPEQRRG